MRFKLLQGIHEDADGTSYKAGDIVETESDLVRSFGTAKFRRMPDPGKDTDGDADRKTEKRAG